MRGVDPQVMLPVEHVAQQRLDDRVPAGARVFQHPGDERADPGAMLAGHRREPVREDPVHHRQGEERPRGLQQLQPGMAAADLLADPARRARAPPRAHRSSR